jgi:hypothetical protein
MKLVFGSHTTIVETVPSIMLSGRYILKNTAIISSVTVSWINIVCDITSISANPLRFSLATITPLDRFPHGLLPFCHTLSTMPGWGWINRIISVIS